MATLEIAQKKRIKTLAFPLLGAGVVGLDKERVKKQIEKATRLFPEIKTILCLKKELNPEPHLIKKELNPVKKELNPGQPG